ncbi:MAG: NAD-dependent epimerase/dehydratase family protein [Hydrogenophaga sp.]|nr:NAD-dependent epimerase/dehydratase family protein [Hydrogenophaga sp.]
MRILVTGADGFLGRGLAAALCEAYPDAQRIVLTDRAFAGPAPSGSETIAGDLGDQDFLMDLLEPGFDLVFHLASVPGGLAEREQDLGHHVNLLAPVALARAVAANRPGARFVFASSIAVYGELDERPVTAETRPAPLITYGAHKLMTEILLSDMTRCGALSAISLRFPGIVARPLGESGHGSAFMSQMFHRIAAGEPYDCPIPSASTCWWMSRKAAVSTLLHAAHLADPVQTVVQPPVLHADLNEVCDAIRRVTGKRARIRWGDDDNLRRIFGAMPPLDATPALALGFRADADLDTLAEAALSGD